MFWKLKMTLNDNKDFLFRGNKKEKVLDSEMLSEIIFTRLKENFLLKEIFKLKRFSVSNQIGPFISAIQALQKLLAVYGLTI